MKISTLLQAGKPMLSFEVFPPKNSDTFDSIRSATEEIATLHPHFMSVTCGAGGNSPQNSGYTVDIARNLESSYAVPTVAHVTCVASSRDAILARLSSLRSVGIENILALRGDVPKDAPDPSTWDYHHAADLVREVKAFGQEFCEMPFLSASGDRLLESQRRRFHHHAFRSRCRPLPPPPPISLTRT